MILDWFRSKPLVDDDELAFIVDVFSWAATHLDGEYFLASTQIITPSAEHFPDSVNSVEAMANSVFSRVVGYAGMSNWPLRLVSPGMPATQMLPALRVLHALRGERSEVVTTDNRTIDFSYNPQQINQPEDLVASFAVGLSHLLVATHVQQTGQFPPGGQAQLAQACDVIAIYLGFGVMLANTAYRFKGGCGSCYNPYANRQAALTESQTIFALALVSHFKPDANVTKYLKSHLKGQFKQARNQLKQYIKETPQPLLLAMESSQHAKLS
jgi:hypothetical protein